MGWSNYRVQAQGTESNIPNIMPKAVTLKAKGGRAWNATAASNVADYVPRFPARRTNTARTRAFIFDIFEKHGASAANVFDGQGSGVFGDTMRVAVTPQTRAALAALRLQLTHRVESSPPVLGSSVIVKLQFAEDMLTAKQKYKTRYWMDFLKSAIMEARIHRFLMKRPKIRLTCGAGVVTVAADSCVPAFHFSGAIPSLGMYVIVMAHVPGVTMKSQFVPRRDAGLPQTTPEEFASLEKAAMTLAMFGVAHGDFQKGNLIVDPKGHVTVIDFGMSRWLPMRLRNIAKTAVQQALSGQGTANAVWHGANGTGGSGTLVAHMNALMEVNYDIYHSEARFIRKYYTEAMRSVNAVERLARARARVWGCATAFKNTGPAKRKRGP